MKKLAIFGLAILLSGCAGSFKQSAEQVINKHNLRNKVTTVCYDYWDKKDCPKGTLQYDIDVVPYIPSNSRFCFGTTSSEDKTPIGMYCYKRDIIK